MKIAISNIAWDPSKNDEVYGLLSNLGVKYLEICPSKLWETPTEAKDQDIRTEINHMAKFGLKPIAMQAILYGHPELTIFESAKKRLKTKEYLIRMIDLAEKIGVSVIVFGSPKNRMTSGKNDKEIKAIANDFFGSLKKHSEEHNVNFCIEPNPIEYGTDFINNLSDAKKLLEDVGEGGFGVNVDSGAMIMNEEPGKKICDLTGVIHYHISQPNLKSNYHDNSKNHVDFADTLRRLDYNGFCSVEMIPTDKEDPIKEIEESIAFARSIYQ